MSRHRRSDSGDDDEDVVPGVITDDEPTTGSHATPPRTRVVIVPRPRPSEPEPAGDADVADATASGAPRVGLPGTASETPVARRREWSDAPGGFVRTGDTGPQTLPPMPPPAASTPFVPLPHDAWGPWPPDGEYPLPSMPSRPAVPFATQPPPRRGPGALMIGGITVLVVLLLGLGVALVQPGLVGLHGSPLFEVGGEPGPGTTEAGSTSEVAPVGSERPSAAAPADPATELRDLARSDAASLQGVENTWVPQLASKRPGTVADGRTWDAAAILAEHQQLRARYPEARLLWSGDWPVFGAGDYWVTVLASPALSPGGANGWCDGQGLGADACFAKYLSRTAGSDGTAVHR
ncbi:hypothetical protein Acsp06_33790 [Actinomycetospora sp. NBRC 106375]|uniref:hypothetical protein n=1 Tax=Actinomycetospora sp. NBRC 106375 TaxID=3032207 RepID=UPI0024A16B42|nr:hypothetical protein [Actinomycetospora sp. NBRC 106375]GLZ47194.1 hypothetical protein Acsp06_33790 [Actinomycetospora sp. NBRC 106375]